MHQRMAIFWATCRISLRSVSLALPNERRSLFKYRASLPELPQPSMSVDFRLSKSGNLGRSSPS
jgi:hypothetical protein